MLIDLQRLNDVNFSLVNEQRRHRRVLVDAGAESKQVERACALAPYPSNPTVIMS